MAAKPVTLREVALQAGVSRSAVSRAFTPGASVSPRTRAAIEKAAAELGYSPSVLASALTTGRTKMIGLVSNNFHNPVFLEIFDQFTRGLQDRGLRPLLVNLSGGMDGETAVEMLRRYSVDGVILASSTLPAELALRFRDAGLPVVHSFGRRADQPLVNLVGVDNRACGGLAARTLSNAAIAGLPSLAAQKAPPRPKIALPVSGRRPLAIPASRSRPASPKPIPSTQAAPKCSAFWPLAPVAEAWFCGDDVLSIGALSALADAGLKVPQDVGIIGFNDMEMARWANINLTTIRQPIAEIIAASIDLVVAAVEDEDLPPVLRLFDCSVVERGTLKPRA